MDKIKHFKKLSNLYAIVVFSGIVIIGVLRGTETITADAGQIAMKLMLLLAFSYSLFTVLKYKYFVPFDFSLIDSWTKFLISTLICIAAVIISILSLVGV
ncbi:MAG: hypothetical protein ABJK64_00295 [Paraglaciecola sp.]|uniref:hypothetical protein n=1 Tax=Paraglaciecola sp. TaxID=1920173 RepID=UPI0032993D61